MRCLPLCEVRLRHAYYADERCVDFGVVPTRTTAQLLRNHRLLLRSFSGGSRVLAELVSGTEVEQPLVPLRPDAVLEFQLQLHNPALALFTDLDAWREHVAPLLTNRNLAAGQGGVLELAPERLEPSLERGAFAHVELRGLHAVSLGGSPPVFEVRFEPRKSHWVYYVIAEPSADAAAPAIEDAGGESGLAFDAYRLHPPAEPSEPVPLGVVFDATAAALAHQYPECVRYRLTSRAPLSCASTPRKNLRMTVGSDATVLTEHLANPAVHNLAELIVERDVGGGTVEATALPSHFRVVKH